jgi:hypothetical protein
MKNLEAMKQQFPEEFAKALKKAGVPEGASVLPFATAIIQEINIILEG